MAKGMNAKQRERIAHRLADIARACGAEATVTNRMPQYREQYVEAIFPEVSVSMDIANFHDGGIMAHWYKAARPLTRGPFDSINEYHRTKASLYRATPETFEAAFKRACEAVADGSAFAKQ